MATAESILEAALCGTELNVTKTHERTVPMPKTFTNVRDWFEHCDRLNAHPEEREVYLPRSSRSTAESTTTTEEDNMSSSPRISMHDVTEPGERNSADAVRNDVERPRLTGRDVLKFRENHGGRAPWERVANDAAQTPTGTQSSWSRVR